MAGPKGDFGDRVCRNCHPGSDDVPRLNKPFMQQDLARAIASIARQQDEAGRVVQFRPR